MSNGSNSFGVTLPQIRWISQVLSNHPNVSKVVRTNDIQFDVTRLRGSDLRLVCLNEYTCGIARVYEVLEVFPGTNIIYVGGNWNGYTREAKDFCLATNLGLYNSGEINGALHRNEFWSYCRKDERGNPVYPTKAS